eukprot:GHVU01087516.1.p2 GENE.GHVU01087516.1~~GHVU01087516.1.p2  ORF type:complete len:109 (+),score=2.58 GHVU01087516.1:1674-2000(+)
MTVMGYELVEFMCGLSQIQSRGNILLLASTWHSCDDFYGSSMSRLSLYPSGHTSRHLDQLWLLREVIQLVASHSIPTELLFVLVRMLGSRIGDATWKRLPGNIISLLP